MTSEEILEKITAYGDQAHDKQMRKYTPDRYMVHPVRVMEHIQGVNKDISVLSAALLHDVLEDTSISEAEMEQFLHTVLPPEQAKKATRLVVDLTDVYVKSAYPSLNRRERKSRELVRLSHIHPDAQTIKYADILDNTLEIVDQDPHFARVYLREVKDVLEKLHAGHPGLRKEALRAVTSGLKSLR